MNEKVKYTSIDIGRAALKIALTADRGEETRLKAAFAEKGIRLAAVDFGGEFTHSIVKIVERAVVAAQREGLAPDNHVGSGAVAGAANAALEQIKLKALGFNVGGKIGIARYDEHLCVAIFMGIGVLNLNEMCAGLAHRSLPKQ